MVGHFAYFIRNRSSHVDDTLTLIKPFKHIQNNTRVESEDDKRIKRNSDKEELFRIRKEGRNGDVNNAANM